MHRLSVLSLLSLISLGMVGCKGGDPTCAQRDAEELQWYEDQDRDGYGNNAVFVMDCRDVDGNGPQGFVVDNTDCDDLRPAVFPTAPELCDGLDNNCNVSIDDGLVFSDFWIDGDMDGFGDPSLQVAACDAPQGAATQPGDCNDADPLINPDAVEICDQIDNDCDGFTDDEDDLPVAEGGVDLDSGSLWYPDADGDTYGSWIEDLAQPACAAPLGFVADNSDCNDSDMQINVDNQEICNGIDDDCDQLYDDSDPDLDPSTRTEYFIDADADGFGDPTASIFTCTIPWFYAPTDDDCDDSNEFIWNDGHTLWLLDADGDGFGAGTPSDPMCGAPGNDWVPQAKGVDCDDLDPEVHPDAVEVCDLIDNDCDALIDDADLFTEDGGVDVDTMTLWYADGDGDGFGDLTLVVPACEQPAGTVPNFDDCNDADAFVNPNAIEACDLIDNDCDFLIDDLDPNLDVDTGTLWVEDADGDGWGNLAVVVRSCDPPLGYIDSYGDCDDQDPFLQLPSTWWLDSDGDGQGAGDVIAPATCFAPGVDFVPHYVDSPEDCDPADPSRLTGPEICYDGIDQGCDGNDFTANGDCELDLPEACDQANLFNAILAQVDPVVISGTLADAIDDFEVGPHFLDCTNGPIAGGDEVVRITVPANSNLQVSLSIQGGDSSIYLLSSCDALTSCLSGSDTSTLQGSVERVQWENTTADPVTLYAVLDGRDVFSNRAFTLTIELL